MLLCVSLSIKMLKIGGWIFKFFPKSVICFPPPSIPESFHSNWHFSLLSAPRSHFQAHLWWCCTRAFKRELSLFSDLRLGIKFLVLMGFEGVFLYLIDISCSFIHLYCWLMCFSLSLSHAPSSTCCAGKGNDECCGVPRVRVCSPGWMNRYLGAGLGWDFSELRLGSAAPVCSGLTADGWKGKVHPCLVVLPPGEHWGHSCPNWARECLSLRLWWVLTSLCLWFFPLVSPDWHLSVLGRVCLHCTCGEPGAVQYFHVSRVKGEEHYTCTLIYASEAANRVKCDLSTALLHDSSAWCNVTLSDINPQPGKGELLQSIHKVLGWESY